MAEIIAIHGQGTATEHSYRAPLQALLQTLAGDGRVQNEPKQIRGVGAVDFSVRNANGLPIAHIEAKDIGIDLREKKGRNAEQRNRYLKAYSNIAYTNGIEWDFYQDGQLIDTVRIASLFTGIQPLEAEYERLKNRLRDFLSQSPERITSPEFLAKRMSAKALIIKDALEHSLNADEEKQDTALYKQFLAFEEVLIHDITIEDFADIYAETIAYGMFAARLHDTTPPDFSRQEAMERLPKSNPFLRNLFNYIASQDLDKRVEREIDQLAELFLAMDPGDMVRRFNNLAGRSDPYIHFYETFLAEYNPAKRKARGVWYTPEAVVNFIVRSVDEVLKTEFGLADGLADRSKIKIDWDTGETDKKSKAVIHKREVHRVQILDPATGTGTFLAGVIKQIAPQVQAMGNSMWNKYIIEHLVPRLHGFELLMASYAMCHMKLDLMLSELGYKPKSETDRLGVYLTNSLEEGVREIRDLFMANWLTKEAKAANIIKRDMPIMCVIGNPPYSVSSQNNSLWIKDLMKEYKKGLKKQKNIQPLSDDYIKFIRMSQHMITKTGEGVLGFITNNSYFDGLIHRQMRKSLMENFDTIYVLDLHGSAMKKERSPDGGNDVNVFDIMQGVGIIIGMKTGKKKKGELAEIFHKELWGARKSKYEALFELEINRKEWTKLKAVEPNFFFVPKDFSQKKTYENGMKLDDLFAVNACGMVSARDKTLVRETSIEAEDVKSDFLNLDRDSFVDKHSISKDSSDWTFERAKSDAQNAEIRKITYRPFDERYIPYTNNSKGILSRPRAEIMRHMKCSSNIAILSCKQQSTTDFAHVFLTQNLSDKCTVSLQTKEAGYHFPLYLYPDETNDQSDAFTETKRVPNLNKKLMKKFSKIINLKFIPDHEDNEVDKPSTFHSLDFFDYIYGTLHSPNYRKTYKNFLKIDFPRIPYPKDVEEFWEMVKQGGALRKLHLMETDAIGALDYPISGDGELLVEKPKFIDGAVWLNKTQRFNNVPKDAWEFYIGGYQPAQKWLKDRKDRELSFDDIVHYQKIIKILCETDLIMKEIG